ncbi:TPA: AAA family ATPase, partial [Candidatus Woesearchaeota archaeon]|nr:AAA family ATPase [Candidatus Woesearchaeota archaeon]
MKEINEILELLNPWWKDGSVSRDLARPYKRRVFNRLLKLVDYRQIIILSGLRRVGKTTLLYQIIENLLKSSDPKHVLYFNLDKSAKDLKEILNAYEELVGVNWKKERIFVLIDEIAKLD